MQPKKPAVPVAAKSAVAEGPPRQGRRAEAEKAALKADKAASKPDKTKAKDDAASAEVVSLDAFRKKN